MLTANNEQVARALAVARTIHAGKLHPEGYRFQLNLVGPPGVGKTMGPKLFSACTGIPTKLMRTGTREATELSGCPVIVDGQRVRYAWPDEYPDPSETGEVFVIFDEWDRQSSEAALNAICGFALDGLIGSYQMPESAWCCSTMNGSSDEYTIPLPHFGRQRACHLYLAPTRAGWCQYAEGAGYHRRITQFMSENWDNVNTAPTYEDLAADQSFYTRNASFCSAVMKACDLLRGKMQVSDIEPLLLQGLLGFNNMIAFYETEATRAALPSVSAVMSGPTSAAVPDDPCLQVSMIVRLVGASKNEQLNERPAAVYLSRLSRDVAEFGFRQIGVFSPRIFATDEYIRWENGNN